MFSRYSSLFMELLDAMIDVAIYYPCIVQYQLLTDSSIHRMREYDSFCILCENSSTLM